MAARHRVRVVLTSYRALSLALVVPQAVALAVVEAIGALVTGRPGQARAELGAWPWNLRRLPSLLAARRDVRSFRRVGDRAVARYQVRGLVGPRVRLLRVEGEHRALAGRRAPAGRRAAAVPVRGHMDLDPSAWSPTTALMAAVVTGVIVFGSRHLLTRYVPVVGEMVPLGGSARSLLDEWASGWRSVGLGAEAAAPALVGAAGALAGLLGGHTGLVRTMLVVGLLPLGVVGAHRLCAPAGSKRAQVAGALAYAAVPLPYDALSAGRWSALAAYAAAPWMLARLARASAVPPFGPASEADGDTAGGRARDGAVVRHRLWKHVVATGTVTALAGMLVPQAPALLLLMGAALVAGGLLAFEPRGSARVLVGAVGGAAVAAALHLPTTLDVLASKRAVEAWLGADRVPERLPALDLLALDTGTTALGPVAFALLGAAAVPLLVGRRWRLGWAVRGWTLALVCLAAAWLPTQGWVPGWLPGAGVVLAPGAAGLALAVGLGVAAIDHDVRGRSWRFGYRRLVATLGALGLVTSTASVMAASMDGWWSMPRDDFAGLLGFVDDDLGAHADERAGASAAGSSSRVLWIGETELLPGGDGWELADHRWYTASATAVPRAGDLWPATARPGSPRIRRALDQALGHQTTRLGGLLAPLGVRYVALPRRLAPSDDTRRPDLTADLRAALAEQLDLERVAVDPGLVLYRNTAFTAGGGGSRVGASTGDPTEQRDHSPASHRLVLAAQVALWLLALAVGLRMLFGVDEPRQPARQGHRLRETPVAGRPVGADGHETVGQGGGARLSGRAAGEVDRERVGARS
jgi:hypothetical protein